jgi:hypothetical protein
MPGVAELRGLTPAAEHSVFSSLASHTAFLIRRYEYRPYLHVMRISPPFTSPHYRAKLPAYYNKDGVQLSLTIIT